MPLQREIKSYVLRAGRVSPRQQQGLDLYLANYALPYVETPWDLTAAFERTTVDTIVEIGFGMGASLLKMAQQQPEVNFIGVEVHRAGIGRLAADLQEHAVTNVRIAPFDATDVFKYCLADDSLTGIQIYFPDPWPKKRHHKRRLIQAHFIQMLIKKIKIGGFIHCATDWQPYADHMLEVLTAESTLYNQQTDGGFSPRPERRPITKFEQRGTGLGHGVWDLIFIRR